MSEDANRPTDVSGNQAVQGREGVLTIGTARAVVMTETAYVFLMKILHEHAPHVIKYAFYDMGYQVGKQLMEALQVGNGDPEEAFRGLVENYKLAGYGNLEVVHFDLSLPEARLAGSNLFETGVATKSGVYRTPRCVDHYSRGMFAGFMSSLLDTEVVCEELECQFREDPKCLFVILPFERLSPSGSLSATAAQRARAQSPELHSTLCDRPGSMG